MAPVDAENHVYEGALEFNIPLLKDVPGFQDLSTNLADRYTKYSTFDAVESWKIGLNWQIVDSLRFRSTYVVGYPRAEPQRPVPAGGCHFDAVSTTGSRAAATRACGSSRAAIRT